MVVYKLNNPYKAKREKHWGEEIRNISPDALMHTLYKYFIKSVEELRNEIKKYFQYY